jgi:hypothetical protein
MNLTNNDYGLIHDAITWELELLPLHQKNPNSPRAQKLREIQARIDLLLLRDGKDLQ